MNKQQSQKLSLQNLKSARLTLEDTDFSALQHPTSNPHNIDQYDSFDDDKDHNYIVEPEKENFAGFANPENFASFGDNQPWDPNLEKNLARLRASAPLLPLDNLNQKTAPKSSKAHAPKLTLDDSDIISDQTTKQDSQHTQSSSSNSQKQCKIKPTQIISSHTQSKEQKNQSTKPKTDLFSDLINMIDGKEMRSSLNLKGTSLSSKYSSNPFNSQKSGKNQEVDCIPLELNQYDYDFAPCLEIPRIKQKNARSRSNSRRLQNEFSPDRFNEGMRVRTEESDNYHPKITSGKSHYHRSPQTQDRDIARSKHLAKENSNNEKYSHQITNFLQQGQKSDFSQKFGQPDSIAVSPIKVVQEQPSNIIGFDQQGGDMMNQDGFDFVDEAQQAAIDNAYDFRSKDKEIEFNTESFQELSLLLENRNRKNESNFCGYKTNTENSKGKQFKPSDSKPNARQAQHLAYASSSESHVISELNDKIAELLEKNASLDKQNQQLRQENQRLSAAFEEKGLLVVNLQNQIEYLLPKLDRLKQLESSAAKHKEKAQKLESENNELRRSYSRLEKEFVSVENSYRNQLETLRRELEGSPEEAQFIESHRGLKPKQDDFKQSKNVGPGIGVRKSQENFKLLEGSPTHHREKSGDEERLLKDLLHYKKNTERFIKCIIKMVVDCAPSHYIDGQVPDLKLAWKFIKKMMVEFAATKKEFEYLKKDEEILQKCTDLLFLEEKAELLPKINEILMKKNRLSKIISKVKLHLNLSSLEEIENYFTKVMSPGS